MSVDDLNTLVWRAYARGRAEGFEAGHDAAQDLAAADDGAVATDYERMAAEPEFALPLRKANAPAWSAIEK